MVRAELPPPLTDGSLALVVSRVGEELNRKGAAGVGLEATLHYGRVMSI